MGNNWSSRSEDKIEELWAGPLSSSAEQRPIFQTSTTNTNSSAVRKDIQATSGFTPTLYFVDLTWDDINFCNSLAKFESNSEKSFIYFTSTKNVRTLVKFMTSNIEFNFERCKRKPSINSHNNKFTQVYGTEKFIPSKLPGICCVVHEKRYMIGDSKKKSILELPKIDAKPYDGKIYLTKDKISILIPISGSLPVNYQYKKSNTANDKNSRTAYNCGSLMMKLGEDLCNVKFDMTEIEFSNLSNTTSRACQVEDPCTYIQYTNTFNKKVFLPVPMSTYVYKDPKLEIEFLSKQRKMKRIRQSIYKFERKKNERNSVEEHEESTLIYKQIASTFLLEKGESVLRLKTGILRGGILTGKHLYADFVRGHCLRNQAEVNDMKDG